MIGTTLNGFVHLKFQIWRMMCIIASWQSMAFEKQYVWHDSDGRCSKFMI